MKNIIYLLINPELFSPIKPRGVISEELESERVWIRLLANPVADIAACRWNGELLGSWRQVRAEVLADDHSLIPELNAHMDTFYGDYRRELTQLMAQLGKALCYIRLTSV